MGHGENFENENGGKPVSCGYVRDPRGCTLSEEEKAVLAAVKSLRGVTCVGGGGFPSDAAIAQKAGVKAAGRVPSILASLAAKGRLNRTNYLQPPAPVTQLKIPVNEHAQQTARFFHEQRQKNARQKPVVVHIKRGGGDGR